MSFINYVLAISNFIAIAHKPSWFLLLIASISALMHLSDNKHGLKGIYPFNKHTYLFLQLDRFMCVALTIFVIPKVTFTFSILFRALLALTCLFVSENIILEVDITKFAPDNVGEIFINRSNREINSVINKTIYLLFHYIWHIMIFDLLIEVLQ